MSPLRLSLAHLVCEIHVTSPRLLRRMRVHYAAYACARRSVDVRIELRTRPPAVGARIGSPRVRPCTSGWCVTRADFAVAGRRSAGRWTFHGSLAEDLFSLDTLLRIVLSLVLPTRDAMLLHGAGIRFHGSGCAFLGRSGAGKTTLCRKAPRPDVFNDELVVLARDPRVGWRLYGSPFWGEMAADGGRNWRRQRLPPARLGALFFLARSGRPAWVGAHGVLRSLLHFDPSPSSQRRILALVAKLMRETTSSRLAFSLEDDWDTISRSIGRTLAQS